VYRRYTGNPYTVSHHIVYGHDHITDGVQPYSNLTSDSPTKVAISLTTIL
jgi:hypothetical protein